MINEIKPYLNNPVTKGIWARKVFPGTNFTTDVILSTVVTGEG